MPPKIFETHVCIENPHDIELSRIAKEQLQEGLSEIIAFVHPRVVTTQLIPKSRGQGCIGRVTLGGDWKTPTEDSDFGIDAHPFRPSGVVGVVEFAKPLRLRLSPRS
jgi:hypothetical protein